MIVPTGIHDIVFEIKPPSYKIGNAVSMASSIFFIIFVTETVFIEDKKRKKL